MNRLEDKNKKPSGLSIKKSILIIIVFVLFVIGVFYFTNSSYMDEKKMLSEAIDRDIIHCYSVEGFYPPSVEYMVTHYGLRYDDEKYVIEYNVIGKNIMPSYKIVEKDGGNTGL